MTLNDVQFIGLDRLAESIQALPAHRRVELNKIMEKRALTVEETAEVLSTHPETIRRMIREGGLFAVRLGSGPRSPYRVPNEEIDRFLREGPRDTTKEPGS